MVISGDSCYAIAQEYDITLDKVSGLYSRGFVPTSLNIGNSFTRGILVWAMTAAPFGRTIMSVLRCENGTSKLAGFLRYRWLSKSGKYDVRIVYIRSLQSALYSLSGPSILVRPSPGITKTTRFWGSELHWYFLS